MRTIRLKSPNLKVSISAFLVASLLIVSGSIIFSRSVAAAPPGAGYDSVPTYLPEPVPEPGQHYINLTNGGSNTAETGYGANVPDSHLRVYSRDNNAKTVTVTIYDRGAGRDACKGYDIYTNITSAYGRLTNTTGNQNPKHITYAIASYDHSIYTCAQTYDFVIPAGSLDLVNVAGYGDFYKGTINFELIVGNINNYKATATLKVLVNNQAAKIGYAANQYVTIYPSKNRITGHSLDMYFRPACEGAPYKATVNWQDMDYPGTAQAQTYKPHIYILEYDSNGNFVRVAEDSNGNNPYFVAYGGAGYGGTDFWARPGYRYGLYMGDFGQFNGGIDGGNGVSISIPFDSTDWYFPCYWELNPSTQVNNTPDVNDDYVEQGKSATFKHYVYNSGSATAPGDYWRWAGFKYDFTTMPLKDPDDIYRGGTGYQGPALGGGGTYAVPDNQNQSPSITVRDDVRLGSRYCQNYNNYPASSYSAVNSTGAEQCAHVVGGKTDMSVKPDSNDKYIEPTQSTVIRAQMTTQDFSSWGNYTGYNVNCNYRVTKQLPGGPDAQTGSGSCNKFISANGTVDAIAYPYTATDPVGTKICLYATVTGTSSVQSPTGNDNLLAPGVKNVEKHFCIWVVTKPYIKVYSGDVSAGNNFNHSGLACQNPKANIYGWNKGSGFNNYQGGAGGQLGVFAQNQIRAFVSGQGLPRPPTNGYGYAPSNLSFANAQVNTGSELYGGSIKNGDCTPDYYSTRPSSANEWPGFVAANTEAGTGASPIYKHDGDLTISGTTGVGGDPANVINNGNDTRVYVDGDVYIRGNIEAAAGATDADSIPNFTLIARGNIYIAPGVTKLYGTYVAQTDENGNKGKLYTCSGQSSRYNTGDNNYADPSHYGECGQQLIITGSFTAKKIFFLRTFGSLYKDNGEASVGGSGRSNASELFLYNPLLWIRQGAGGLPTGNASFQSITSLPPVL